MLWQFRKAHKFGYVQEQLVFNRCVTLMREILSINQQSKNLDEHLVREFRRHQVHQVMAHADELVNLSIYIKAETTLNQCGIYSELTRSLLS